MYLQFLSVFHTEITQVVENPFPCVTRLYLFYKIIIMSADDLGTQGAWASATMMLDRINSVPTR